MPGASTSSRLFFYPILALGLALACLALLLIILEGQHTAQAAPASPWPNDTIEWDYDYTPPLAKNRPDYLLARCLMSKRGRIWIEVEGRMVPFSCRDEFNQAREG